MKSEVQFKSLDEYENAVSDKLNMESTKLEEFQENEYAPEEKKEEEAALLTNEDVEINAANVLMNKTLKNLYPQNVQKWASTVKHSGMGEIKEVKQFKCTVHKKRNVCYVCVNSNCKTVFFCQQCLPEHSKKCDRENMFFNNVRLNEKEFVNEYYDYDDFDFDEEADKIKEKFLTLQENFKTHFEILEKIALDNLKFYSKEFKIRRMKQIVEKDLENFNKNPTSVTYYRLALNNFKFQKLNEFEKIKNCEEQQKLINELIHNLSKNLQKNIQNFKKDTLKKSKEAIKNFQKEALNSYNVEMINSKVSKENITLHKFDNNNFISSTNTLKTHESKRQPQNDSIQTIPRKSLTISSKSGSVLSTIEKDSQSLLKNSEIDFLIQELQSQFSSSELIYRISSKKGFSVDSFNKKCSNIAPTALFCVTKEGKKFGVVNYLNWSKEASEMKTDKNFIFSIDKKSIHKLQKVNNSRMSETAIDYEEDSGPIVGEDDIVIGQECDKKEDCTSDLGNAYEFKGDNGSTYLAGKENFQLKQLFVFKLNK